jgi:hypothetical protein
MSKEDAAANGAGGDPATTDPAPKPRSDESTKPSRPSNLGTLAGFSTLAIAVAGAAWFALLSFAAAIAYAPLGVRPNEIGLSSGTLLTQSAILWVGVGVTGLVASAIVVWVLWGRSVREDRSKQVGLVLGFVTGTVLTSVATGVLWPAVEARHALKKGHKPGPIATVFFLFHTDNPWSAEIASFSWAHDPGTHGRRLPTCALYLGEAGGISVLYDPAAKPPQTWRVPSSELIVRAKPSLSECP